MYNLITRDSSSNGSAHNTTTIIIAVCASLGGIILAFVLFRTIRRLYQRDGLRSNPLPPVQPLAHQRERHVSQFFERDLSDHRLSPWHDTAQLSGQTLNSNGSNVSLLPHKILAPPLFHDSSVGIRKDGESPDSLLMLPVPSFRNGTSSSSSLNSSISGPSFSHPGTPLSNASHSSSPLLQSSSFLRTSRSPRVRPVSLASNFSNAHTTKSRASTIRGLPHAPYSNFRIVMPAPLAPQLNPYYTTWSGQGANNRRASVVDKWASAAIGAQQPIAGRRRSTSSPAQPRNTHTPHRSTLKHSSPPSSFPQAPTSNSYRSYTPPSPLLSHIQPRPKKSASSPDIIARPRSNSLSLPRSSKA